MSKKINIFSANKINQVEDYERFAHTKAYLRKKSGPVNYYFKNQIDELKSLAIISGYKPENVNKFIEHRKEWHQLERKIPLAYLKAISAKINVINFTLELDIENFEKALDLAKNPKYFTVRMNSFYYQSKKFNKPLNEKEAIEFLKKYSNKEGFICFINYPAIKTITVFPSGKVDHIYYKPGLEREGDFLVPTLSGKGIGRVAIM